MLKRYSYELVYLDGNCQVMMCDNQMGKFVCYGDVKPLADRVQHAILTLNRDDITDEMKIKICKNELNEYLIEMRGSDNSRINPNRLEDKI